MELPVRLVARAGDERVISVDGAFDAPGLNLSHWPGNRTPAPLKRDLSTGIALAFSALPRAEREDLAAGCVAIENNHYDTDGVCALFAVRWPERALPRAERLLAAAEAGDFFRWPDDDALAVDALVTGLADPERSPLAPELAGLADRARHQHAQAHLFERLDAILDGDLAPYRDLVEPALAAARSDRDALASAVRSDDRALELTTWRADADLSPGRHVLFGATGLDRALVLARRDGGTTCRLVVSTLSWFDLVSRPPTPRPDLRALAAALNELEGTAPGEARAWRAQPPTGASPELWFGRDGVESFAERNDFLAPSALPPAMIEDVVREALAG